MFPHIIINETGLDLDTSYYKIYLDYIEKYWPELEHKAPSQIQEFFGIEHDYSREDIQFTLYGKIQKKLEEIRKRLIVDSFNNGL